MVKVLGSQDATGGLSKNSFGERWSHRTPPWKPDYTMLKKKCMRASKQGERRHLGERHCYRESGNIISVEDTEALRLQQN